MGRRRREHTLTSLVSSSHRSIRLLGMSLNQEIPPIRNTSNGNYRDRQGRLLTCEHDTRRVTRTEYDGTITVLMDRFQDKKLNAPNDLAVYSDGAIWFRDPGYGIMSNYEGHKAPFELPGNVYRLDPKTREATFVATDMGKPQRPVFLSRREKALHRGYGNSKTPRRRLSIRFYDVGTRTVMVQRANKCTVCARSRPEAKELEWK
jgi:hypothetical protein